MDQVLEIGLIKIAIALNNSEMKFFLHIALHLLQGLVNYLKFLSVTSENK
jgi:hypothetical protein